MKQEEEHVGESQKVCSSPDNQDSDFAESRRISLSISMLSVNTFQAASFSKPVRDKMEITPRIVLVVHKMLLLILKLPEQSWRKFHRLHGP